MKFAEPEPEQLSAAKKMINKLKMKTYHPEAFENPDLQAHYSLIESLALARDDVVMGKIILCKVFSANVFYLIYFTSSFFF